MVKEANFTGILSNEQKFNPGMTFYCHLLIWSIQVNKFPFHFQTSTIGIESGLDIAMGRRLLEM